MQTFIANPLPADALPPARGPSPAFLVVLLAVIVLPLVALGQFVAHARTDELDGYLFACFGRDLLGGAGLYSDLWDIKPPGIFWVDALGLWLGDGSLNGVRVLCAAALIVSIAIMGWHCLRRYGRMTAFVATVMAAVYLPLHEFHVGGNRPCTFYVLTDLVAFALYLRAWRGGSPGRVLLVVTGFAAGLSVCFKQTAIAFVVAAALHLLIVDRRAALARLSCVGAGFMTAVIAAGAGIAARGDLAWAWDALVMSPIVVVGAPGASSIRRAVDWIPACAAPLTLPLLLAAAVGCHALLRRRADSTDDDAAVTSIASPPRYLALLWCWLAVALTLAMLGIPNRAWYLASALPPVLLLAAHAIRLLVTFVELVPGGKPAFPLTLAVIWFGVMMAGPVHMQIDMAFRQYHRRFVEGPPANVVALVEAILAHTDDGDSVFLYGYQPQVHWLSKRRSASRFYGTLAAGADTDPESPGMHRIITDMQARSPALIQWPPDAIRPADGEFATWLAANYREVSCERLTGVWLRTDRK